MRLYQLTRWEKGIGKLIPVSVATFRSLEGGSLDEVQCFTNGRCGTFKSLSDFQWQFCYNSGEQVNVVDGTKIQKYESNDHCNTYIIRRFS